MKVIFLSMLNKVAILNILYYEKNYYLFKIIETVLIIIQNNVGDIKIFLKSYRAIWKSLILQKLCLHHIKIVSFSIWINIGKTNESGEICKCIYWKMWFFKKQWWFNMGYKHEIIFS